MSLSYQRPPLIEALCEFRFDPSSPWDATIPGLAYDQLKEEFPVRRQANVLEMGIAMAAVPGANISGQPQVAFVERTQFVREDETAQVQVGRHFLSIHQLKPYISWLQFVTMVERAYAAYYSTSEPKRIHRIGLRYINRIEFPSPRLELKEYVTFYPELGPNLSQDYMEFSVGVQSEYEDRRDLMNLQLASIASSIPGTRVMILDIDYFCPQPGIVTLDNVPSWLDGAHVHIKRTFESVITDKLRAMFGPVEN